MPASRLKSYLDGHKVIYACIHHSGAYTAQRTAQAARVPRKEFAKTVIVKIDGELIMVVLPADKQLDLAGLAEEFQTGEVALAKEKEFANIFPECDVGAMPPFGNLYGMKVLVSELLAEDDVIAFNGGSHTELIKLAFEDFDKLVQPEIVHCTQH